jgi:hypothetical protein
MSLQNYLLQKFTITFLAKPASSVKSCYRWDLHNVKGTSRKVFGVGKYQVDSELVLTANGTGTATIHAEPTILSYMLHV